MWLYLLTTFILLGGDSMDSVEIALKVIEGIEEAIMNGYDRFYMNVDDMETGEGFLRILAMIGPKYQIVYEGTFDLDVLTCLKYAENKHKLKKCCIEYKGLIYKS